MSDQLNSAVAAKEVQIMKPDEVQAVNSNEKKLTENEGYGITEEQEKTLLAGDESDLDVIECYVDDFDSDEEFRRKDAKKVELQEKKASTITRNDEDRANSLELLQVVRILIAPDEGENAIEAHDADPFEKEFPDDEDVIQIVEENVDDLFEEEDEKAENPAEISVHIYNDTKNERILHKPLVKQVVINLPDLSEEDGEETEYRNACTGSPNDRTETPIDTQEDSDAEQPLVIADSVETNVGVMSERHQEDPDVLQLKLDLHQNMGEMHYDVDDEDHQNNRVANAEERLERRIQIKEEPMSPFKDRLERILLEVEDIPTIVLSSDDDFAELIAQQKKKPKKGKKKSKKKTKQRSHSECSVLQDVPTPAEDGLPVVKSTTSSKSLHSSESMIIDEELIKTGFRMELRKRKSFNRFAENGTTPSCSKRSNPLKALGDCKSSIDQSKSRDSISSNFSENILPDKPPKKQPSLKSTNQPVFTTDKLKINSLFADCEKPEEMPASILDDGMPLLDKDGDNSFEKVFKPVKKYAPSSQQHRKTMLIDALPKAAVTSSVVPNSCNERSGMSKFVQKPKMVSEIEQQIIKALENDLAMSSSDEETPQQQEKARSPVPKKVGRKRGRAPKHHIEDYFCPSPGDKKNSQSKKTPVKDSKKSQPQVKRRKKRSRISSCSTNSEDETTATESISLAGTSSTITSREADHEQLPAVPEPRKTDEMRVVLSPLTDEKIEKLSKCNTPKKARALSKASQTELEGLTWRIELNQIDFHSKYFEKLYQLIKNGREQNNLRRGNKNFEGVVMVDRDAVLPTLQEKSPQRPPAAASDHARSNIEQLLFERADEVEYVPAARVDPSARERMKQSVRSNFRIPKIAKQPSRSPQVVTSSTQHDNEQHCKENDSYQTSTGGYSNDVAPDPRRQITIGSRSPLRVENTLKSNRSEVPGHVGDDIVRPPMAPIRRTIRNDQVLAPTAAQPSQQPQPVQNGFPTYGPPEQAPPQPSRYQGNAFQQQLRPSQQHLGAYMASSQEMDVKPNISLNPPAAMLGPGMMNPTRIFDSFSFMCQLTMMQMMQQQQQQQQQLQYQALNPGGQMFPGPSIAPPTVNNPTPAPPMSAQMMPPSGVGPRFVEISDGGQQDEVSDQISQIFGCIDNLKGRCIKNPCQYSHTLPTETTLRQMLLSSAQDIVMTTYQFIAGQDNLFLRYFPVYAEVMGRKNMRHQLIDAVPHCEQSKRAFSHYRFIVEGLTINGTLTRSKAIQLVLEKHKKINFDQINVLINLILETGDEVPQFLTWLEHFSQVQDYHYEIPSINRLLKFCVCFSRSTNALLQGTAANVAKLVYRLVLSVATGKEPFVDTDALVDYAELLMKSNLGLDHEKILDKYRKNELASSATRR